jgi:cyclopropane fatty-acyl-phospholipid synthase-like methyltransferase
MHPFAAAVRAWRSYRGAGVRTRAFLAARLAVLPLRALAAEYARFHGRVLGIGSGHGLLARWVAELNPDVTVDGYDVDAERVAIARATQSRAPRVHIHHQDVRTIDADAAFDAASAIDVVHHIPAEDHPALFASLARAVKPGGILLIKEISAHPHWKHRVNQMHDHIVSGQETHALAPAELAAAVEAAGFVVERVYSAGALVSPYSHFILRARRAPEQP